TGEFLVQKWNEAGLPHGVLNLIQGAAESGKSLCAHPAVAGIFFTGSYDVGSQIHRQIGGHPQKILSLEMGGNNPLIVSEVEDLEAAVYLTISSAFMTSGQRCVCARRIILPPWKKRGEFVALLQERIAQVKIGRWNDGEDIFMGPLISSQAAAQVLQSQRELIEAGATSLVPTCKDKHVEALLTPGLIDVTEVNNRTDEEIFGPLLQLIYVDDFQSAIDEANNTRFGLAAGLFSDSSSEFKQFYNQIRAGIVKWNQAFTGSSARAPFGGVGNSGNHRPASSYSADNFSYPIASMEAATLSFPEKLIPGLADNRAMANFPEG
ncbi:MAG: aldehyde dehydrogenase family protein, partial [Lentisphaeraceae bacterium]|nr:aldehyde dehydrogenase family protein [Lentisphaeraceae bacterium]